MTRGNLVGHDTRKFPSPSPALTFDQNWQFLQLRIRFLGPVVIDEQGYETQRAKSSSTLSGDMLNVLSGLIELHSRLQRYQVYMSVQRAASSSCEQYAFAIVPR